MSDVIKSTEEIYVLKDGSLYNINSRLSTPVPISSVEESSARYQLIIDDSYFFYVFIGKLSVPKKKLKTIVGNYLQSLFPMDLFSGFAVQQNKGGYTALIYKEDFAQLLEEHNKLFSSAKKITTAFCEISARYDSFLFFDGTRTYLKKDDTLDVLEKPAEGTLRAEDVYPDIIPFKTEIHIDGVKGGYEGSRVYLTLGIFTGICFALFIASGVMDILAEKKLERSYTALLQRYYTQAGVAGSPDPFGTLRSQATRPQLAPFRILDVLYALGQAVPDDITIETLSVNDRLVRIDGFAQDFSRMEVLSSNLENKLRKQITVEESRQVGDQIKFVIRYEP